MTTPPGSHLPPAAAAIERYPWLLAQIQAGLDSQLALIRRCLPLHGRQSALETLDAALDEAEGGLIAVEGPPGAGVTTLLAHLAATRPVAFWFADSDAGQGAATLYAQLVGLYDLQVPLIPPTVASDPAVLEQALAEAASRSPGRPAPLLLIDAPACPRQPAAPLPPLFPTGLPPEVTVIYGSTPDTALPLTPRLRVALPLAGDEAVADLADMLRRQGCPSEWVADLVAGSQGSMLYLPLALALARRGRLDPAAPPAGLAALHDAWWAGLSPEARRLALLVAAAGEPLPGDLATTLLGSTIDTVLPELVGFVVAASNDSSGTAAPELIPDRFQLFHLATRDDLMRRCPTQLAAAHASFVVLARDLKLELGDWRMDGAPSAAAADPQALGYLTRQYARHAALSPDAVQTAALPAVAMRPWLRAHERRSSSYAAAAQDVAWELRGAVATGPLLRLARSAALAGTAAARARSLPGDAILEALPLTQERAGREAGLKRILDLVDLLPDGLAKAQVLRRLGEACYAARMRTSAMRLLSRALDLEEQPFPRAWREQREQLLAAMVSAALDLDAVAAASAICERIGHLERRGMAETQVTRWLLARGELARAQKVARQIAHESLGAWARAEVAVALARAGDLAAAEMLLAEVGIETANAWAQIELACDAAAHNERAAWAWIDRLSSQSQRDRGLARLAHALALASKDGDALAAAEQIADLEVRVSALLDLRMCLEGLVAMLALEQATAVIGKPQGPSPLAHDARVPLLATLAAAYAAIGRKDTALAIVGQLNEGEEQDRALSRVAVAFARQGNHDEARALAHTLADDDERDWALDELTRQLWEARRWQEAEGLALQIQAGDQRADTLANLAIARARAGNALAALRVATSVAVPGQRLRALTLIAPALVAEGHGEVARAVAYERFIDGTALAPAERSRYLTAVATAMAEHGALDDAGRIAAAITRPLDRARSFLAIARAAAAHSQERARAALGTALLTAHQGREEAFRLLEQATPVLAALGGAALLTDLAAAIDEIDGW